jgi:hypothetical protein
MKAAEEQKNERKHKRYDIASGAFALLKWNGTEVLGSIKDISRGGLSLSHIDGDEDLEALARITVNLISDKFCYENFIGRSIWSKKEEGAFTTAMVKMKRCGIEFGQNNEEKQLQLKEFIDSHKK